MLVVRWILALFGVWLAGLFSVGGALAFYFAVTGFGSRDGADELAVVGYGLLTVLSAGVGIALWWWLLPPARAWAVPAMVVSVGVTVVMLGLVGV